MRRPSKFRVLWTVQPHPLVLHLMASAQRKLKGRRQLRSRTDLVNAIMADTLARYMRDELDLPLFPAFEPVAE